MFSEQSLRQSILNTLAYFDLADYPLTKEELFSFLWQPPNISYNDFLLSLQIFNTHPFIPPLFASRAREKDISCTFSSERCKYVAEPIKGEGQGVGFKFGYYFLLGREKIVEERQGKLLITEKKLKIARRAAKIIRSVPFLKAVFVCNTAGSGQAGEDSDIDFFIVTEKNRIWITRLFVTFLLELFRLRRVGNRIKNKICLSFYVTTENLDLAKLRVADDDIHFAYWLNQMLPVFDPDNYYLKFLQANSWTKTYLPNLDAKQTASYLSKIPESRLGKIWKKAWEKMWQGSYGDLINNQAKQIQLSKMKQSGKPIDRGNDKGVVINDGILKFHEKDTRIAYRNQWLQKIYVPEKNI